MCLCYWKFMGNFKFICYLKALKGFKCITLKIKLHLRFFLHWFPNKVLMISNISLLITFTIYIVLIDLQSISKSLNIIICINIVLRDLQDNQYWHSHDDLVWITILVFTDFHILSEFWKAFRSHKNMLQNLVDGSFCTIVENHRCGEKIIRTYFCVASVFMHKLNKSYCHIILVILQTYLPVLSAEKVHFPLTVRLEYLMLYLK